MKDQHREGEEAPESDTTTAPAPGIAGGDAASRMREWKIAQRRQRRQKEGGSGATDDSQEAPVEHLTNENDGDGSGSGSGGGGGGEQKHKKEKEKLKKPPPPPPKPPQPVSGNKTIYTVTDKQATVRGGDPDFKPTGAAPIAEGTRVEISVEMTGKDKKVYAHVTEHGSGKDLGFTLKSNLTDLDAKYKEASAKFVYHVAGHDVLVFLPQKGLTPGAKADVFMFFHGDNASYAASAVNTFDDTHENPAKASEMAQAVTNSGRNVIAIAPQVSPDNSPWSAELKAGDYSAIVETVRQNLNADTKPAKPIELGAISLAGHSGGGKALGQAAADLDHTGGGVTDITLQEAGYHGNEDDDTDKKNAFTQSFVMVRDWLLTGSAPKTLRVLSIQSGDGGGTRNVISKGHALSVDGIKKNAIQARGFDKAPKSMTAVETVEKSDGTQRTDDMQLESRIEITANDAKGARIVQGTVWVFRMPSPKALSSIAHFNLRDRTMEDTIGAKNTGADFAHHDRKAGPYRVVNPGGAELHLESDPNKAVPHKRPIKKGETVQVSGFTVRDSGADPRAGDSKHSTWARIDGQGLVLATDLEPASP